MSESYIPDDLFKDHDEAASLSDEAIDAIHWREDISFLALQLLAVLRQIEPGHEMHGKFGLSMDGMATRLSDMAQQMQEDSKRIARGEASKPKLRLVGEYEVAGC